MVIEITIVTIEGALKEVGDKGFDPNINFQKLTFNWFQRRFRTQ